MDGNSPGTTTSGLPFKPFDEMTAEDYANIGLRCGIEVHQQLLTEGKLFCRCPAGRYSDEYDAEILRHMRPTLSELGEYDGTALMEKKTKKNIFYRIHRDTVCTYEMDDTPPFFMDETALDIALELAMLLRLNMVRELHIARKQYLDGSIPTGFQRTTIVGVDGWIPYRDRRIGIRQLGLEEDACREVSDEGHDRVYLTDRLGMPLAEVVTEPDMHTPQEVAEVGQIIRKLCRSTGKVRTGYGAARQDVNVSVRGGTRIEIKGVPQLGRIPRLVYSEALRQCALLGIRRKLSERGITPKTFQHGSSDVTRIVARSQYLPIRHAIEQGYHVKCVRLAGFAGILNEPTQENTTFAKEFSDRVRVIACLTQLPNIVHSDVASESLYGRDWQQLRKRMKARAHDALVLVWGRDADTECACDEIAIRAREATIGVPSDTRQALKEGTNGFERVLPGADRMYPDTDLPPRAIDPERLHRIRERLPAYVWDREAEFREMGLPEDTIVPLCLSPRLSLFTSLTNALRIDSTLAAVALCQWLKALRREGLEPEHLPDRRIYEVFEAYGQGRIAREGIGRVLRSLAAQAPEERSAERRLPDVLASLNLGPVSDQELQRRVGEVLRRTRNLRFGTAPREHRALMGMLMKSLRGCVDGRKLAGVLSEALEEDRGRRDPAQVPA